MNSRITLVAAALLLSSIAIRAQPTAPTPAAVAPPAAAKPTIDPRAMDLLKQSQETMLSLKTFQAECRTKLTRDKAVPNMPTVWYRITTVQETRPNGMRWEWWDYPMPMVPIEQQQRSGEPDVVDVVDGNHRWIEHEKQYTEDPAPATEKIHTGTEPWGGFFTSSFSPYGNATDAAMRGELIEVRIDGAATVGGVECTRVYVHTRPKFKKTTATDETTYYIGADHIVRRSTSYFNMGDGPGISYDNRITSIKINAPIANEAFVYKASKGAKPYTITKNDPSLLHVGSLAPEFNAVDSNGKQVKLSDYRGKTVLIDFWGVWCHVCVASMLDNQAVITRLNASGSPVVLLAVDDSDDRPDFDKWMKSESASYPGLYFVYGASDMRISVKQYKVSGFPTLYLVDKDGIIRATFVGSDSDSDDLVATILAALKTAN